MFKKKREQSFGRMLRQTQRNPVWETDRDWAYVGRIYVKSSTPISEEKLVDFLDYFATQMYECEDLSMVAIRLSERFLDGEKVIFIDPVGGGYEILIV